MLVFVFSALIVVLDQFFKHYIVRTLEIGETGAEIIPGVLGLTRWENDGAMLNILSGQQWLLAGIALIASIVLVMIILRYNEGFWGTLGLAAVLGGAVGNLTDRNFNDGAVVDMFKTLFINFPIFNIADIFITLGFATFIVHFISITVKEIRGERNYVDGEDYAEDEEDDYDYEPSDARSEKVTSQNNEHYDEFPELDSIVGSKKSIDTNDIADNGYTAEINHESKPSFDEEPIYGEQYYQAPSDIVADDNYDSYSQLSSDFGFSLDDVDLGVNMDDLQDYDVDELLREYGIDDDE